MLNRLGSNAHNDDSLKNQAAAFSKETAFGRNWGRLVPVIKSQSNTSRGMAVSNAKQELHASILVSLNEEESHTSRQQTTASAPCPAKPAAACSSSAPTRNQCSLNTDVTATNLGPQEILSVMWDHLELMAEQYNRAVGLGPYHIDIPERISGTTGATMSNSTHALILFPEAEAVRIFVLPIELTRGLYNNGPRFEANAVVLMSRRRGNIEWHTNAGAPLTMSVINQICRSLFQTLVEQTAARLNEV